MYFTEAAVKLTIGHNVLVDIIYSKENRQKFVYFFNLPVLAVKSIGSLP